MTATRCRVTVTTPLIDQSNPLTLHIALKESFLVGSS